jgi:integrase
MSHKRKPIADLPFGVGVTRTCNGAGQEFWRVRLGKKFTGGKPVKKEFPDLDAARKWIGEQTGQQKETGASTYQLSPGQLAEAADAFKRLNGAPLTEAVTYFLSHAKPAGGVRTFKEIAEEFLRSRKAMGVRPRTYVQYESYLRILGEEFNDEPISQIMRSDLEDFFTESEWSPRTRINYMVTLSTIFTFAQDRDYCPGNPAAKVGRPILEDRPVGILKIKETVALLTAALKYESAMIPAVAIGLFAGIRRSELTALDWSEINLAQGTIEVRGSKAKTRQRRIVHVCDSLKKWLLPYARQTGEVTVSKRDDVWGEHLRDLVGKAAITDYPHNGLRHSFGSYHYELHRNEQLTASEMGNSPAVIFRHYRNLVSPADAKQYFSITPRNLDRLSKKLHGGVPEEPPPDEACIKNAAVDLR